MKSKILVPIVLLLMAVTFIYLNTGASMPSGYVDLSPDKVQKRLAEMPAILILDVRTPAEFLQGHLRHALNVDYYAQSFVDKLKELDRNDQYLVYCQTGHRSSETAKQMAELGFKKVWNLAEGVVGWGKAGLPLEQ